MASNPDLVQYIADQCAGAGEITVKKMFGDYGIYCDGVIFGLICDNRFYLKPTKAGRSLLRSVEMRPPYDGAKDYFFIEDVDDRDYLSALVRETCKALPQPKPKDYSYTTERYDTEVNAREYIEGFHNADYFIKFCQQCRNYSRRYGCPPFDYDPLEVIKRYERVRIIGIKIIPEDKHIPLHSVNDLMRPIIAQLNEELLKAEKSLGGMCFGFVGTCPYCGDEPCARIDGKPCRHPDKVRPSLEAFGFDISKTAKDLLGLEIKWSKGDLIPEYLTLVGGIFY